MHAWIERQRCLIDFSVANLGRRKARNLGLLGAYILLVFLLASVVLFVQVLLQPAGEIPQDAVLGFWPAVDLAVAIGALPAAVAGELVARIQRVAALLAGLLR